MQCPPGLFSELWLKQRSEVTLWETPEELFFTPEPWFGKSKSGIKWQIQWKGSTCPQPPKPCNLESRLHFYLQKEVPCSDLCFPHTCQGKGWGISLLLPHCSICFSVKIDFVDFIWWFFPEELRFLMCRLKDGNLWLSSEVSFPFLSPLPLHFIGGSVLVVCHLISFR